MMLQFENDFALLSTYKGCDALERKYGTVNNTDEIESLIVSDEINKIDLKRSSNQCNKIEIAHYVIQFKKELDNISKVVEYSQPLFEKLIESLEKENKTIYGKLTAKAIFIEYYHFYCDRYLKNDFDDIESCKFETFSSYEIEEISNSERFLQDQMLLIENDILETYGCECDEVENFDFYHILVKILIANNDIDVKSLLNE